MIMNVKLVKNEKTPLKLCDFFFSIDLAMLWPVLLYIFVMCSDFWVVLRPCEMLDIPVEMQKRKQNLKSLSGSSH